MSSPAGMTISGELPARKPPDGVVPNFADPEDRTYQIYITAAVCLSIMCLFASLRFYAKVFLLRARTRDDYVFILSLCSGITSVGLYAALASKGLYGTHTWDIQLKEFTRGAIRLTLVNQVTYGPFIWFIKLSLFMLYLEIFGRQIRWLKYLAYSGITITGLFYFSTVIALLVPCFVPINATQAQYLTALISTKCVVAGTTGNIVLGIFNIVSDFYILVLPLPAVWSLQLPMKKKVGVFVVFLTGIGACVSSILALVYRIQVSTSQDKTWVVISLWIVSIVEMTAGVTIPCMGSTKVVYRHLKLPIGSKLRKYGTKLRGLMTSTRTSYTAKETESKVGLQLEDPAEYKALNESSVVVVREWPNNNNNNYLP